jgi:hypothetical protein
VTVLRIGICSFWRLCFFTAFAIREKYKAGAFIFSYRRSRSEQEPEGLKGGKVIA